MNKENEVAALRQQLQQLVFKSAAKNCQNPYSKSVFKQLSQCHTAQGGMHRLRCNDPDCGHEHYQYHNCGNRHCPNCGGMRRQQWLEDKTAELLPTAYYHVVFTLPHELNALIMGNRKLLFALLFEAAGYTLLSLAKDKKWIGATPGIISILHTWGQDLSFHPHVHCIVSGGGIVEDKDGMRWQNSKRKNNTFLFPKPVLQKVFKAYYLKRIRKMLRNNEIQTTDKEKVEKLLHEIGFKRWNVYAKRPLGGPLQVLEYLGRYTHKVAITAHRIRAINPSQSTISFAYKNYRNRNTCQEQQEMTLSITEFARRFEQHILPKGFVKIRHYGYLRNHKRSQRLRALFALLQLPPPPPKVQIPAAQRMLENHGIDISQCPKCKSGKMELVATYYHGLLCKNEDRRRQPGMIRNKDPANS
jgi:hypothetical protein